MSVDTTIAVLYAQSGLSNHANVAMVAPQASLAITRALAAEAMRQERQQVAKSEKGEGKGIDRDSGGRRGFFMSRRRDRLASAPEEDNSSGPKAKSAIVGNLLNMTV